MPPQHPITGDEKHNVTCTAEESNEPCEDCRLPDLDIFRLEEMTKELGYRVSVDVDDGSDKIAVVTKREVTNSFEAAGKQLRDAKETEVDLKCEVVHLLRKEKLCGSAGANETASMMALPYTIGLGLLVAVKNVKAKAEEDRATRKRKRTAKL